MQPLVEEAVSSDWIDPLVVVTPSAGGSYYMDFQDGSELWESMILTELIPQLEADLGIDPARLLISGASMGGVGSLRIAFRHPQRFLAVASLEPGVDPFLRLADKPDWYAMTEDGRLGSKFGTPIDEEFWRANNPASIAMENPDALAGLRILLEVGTHDGLFNHHNVEFLHRVLFDQNIKHEYRTYLGANHMGNSLPIRTLEALKFLGRALRPTESDVAADQFSKAVLQGYEDLGIAPPE